MKNQEALNLAKLPELCYVFVETDPEYLAIVKRGEQGYYKTDFKVGGLDPFDFVDKCNAGLKVTREQANAMSNGSMFGWHTKAADPDADVNAKNYSDSLRAAIRSRLQRAGVR